MKGPIKTWRIVNDMPSIKTILHVGSAHMPNNLSDIYFMSGAKKSLFSPILFLIVLAASSVNQAGILFLQNVFFVN